MEIEISIVDNDTHVSIDFANTTRPQAMKSVDIPKNDAVIEVIGDYVGVWYGKQLIQLDYNLVIEPANVDSPAALRAAIKGFFYL